ncbi:MAG: hypothetical protein ACKOKF_11715 [Bacteroidota bacterium]
MKRIFVSTLLASMTMICSEVVAATYVWNGNGSGGTTGTNFNAVANWLVNSAVPGTAPGPSDDVVFSM